jgi:hypothetical protein
MAFLRNCDEPHYASLAAHANIISLKDPNAQLEQLRRTSLIGPADLKLPDQRLSQRKMPPTASIPEHPIDRQSSGVAINEGSAGGPTARLSAHESSGHINDSAASSQNFASGFSNETVTTVSSGSVTFNGVDFGKDEVEAKDFPARSPPATSEDPLSPRQD